MHPGASAQGAYIGGAYSWATLDVSDVNADLVHGRADAYKLFVGVELPEFVGFEVGYVSFGSYKVGEAGGGTSGNLDSKAWTGALIGRIPIGPLLTVYAKVGYFYWDTQVEGQTIGQLIRNGHDPFYGGGVRVNLGKLSVLGEYERFNRSQLKNDLFSLGLRIPL